MEIAFYKLLVNFSAYDILFVSDAVVSRYDFNIYFRCFVFILYLNIWLAWHGSKTHLDANSEQPNKINWNNVSRFRILRGLWVVVSQKTFHFSSLWSRRCVSSLRTFILRNFNCSNNVLCFVYPLICSLPFYYYYYLQIWQYGQIDLTKTNKINYSKAWENRVN